MKSRACASFVASKDMRCISKGRGIRGWDRRKRRGREGEREREREREKEEEV